MNIRKATMEDLDIVTALEAECFLPEEAASRESFAQRLAFFADHFWLLEEDGVVISCINGFVTDDGILNDEMYADASQHNEEGMWQMIFGVMTKPEYQGRGYASVLMKHVIEECRAQKRKGIVLTCKKEKIGFYEQFGYVNEGQSESTHGGESWNLMRLVF